MTKPVNIREICLDDSSGDHRGGGLQPYRAAGGAQKYQYLEKRDRAFISRVVEGTLEHMIQLDYIIEQFSNVPVYNMKPLIRNLLRMSVYQLKYMDSVPDSAACNEAVKLAQRRGFYNLKGFRERRAAQYGAPLKPGALSRSGEGAAALSVSEIFFSGLDAGKTGVTQYGYEVTEKICLDSHMEKGTVVRCNLQQASKKEIIAF